MRILGVNFLILIALVSLGTALETLVGSPKIAAACAAVIVFIALRFSVSRSQLTNNAIRACAASVVIGLFLGTLLP